MEEVLQEFSKRAKIEAINTSITNELESGGLSEKKYNDLKKCLDAGLGDENELFELIKTTRNRINKAIQSLKGMEALWCAYSK